jgi:Fe-S-cluster containining protein
VQGRARASGEEQLIVEADAALARGRALCGRWLACRLGCDECCMGPFPINALDALRLRRGLAALAKRDPERAEAVRARAREATGRLRPEFPGDATSGLLADDEDAESRFAACFAELPCPALDRVARSCELYEWRPLACRTFGPPVRIGGEDLAPCRLCFVGAPLAEIERCRVGVDPEGQEDILLDALEDEGLAGETVVAFALVGEDGE